MKPRALSDGTSDQRPMFCETISIYVVRHWNGSDGGTRLNVAVKSNEPKSFFMQVSYAVARCDAVLHSCEEN